MTLHSNNQFTVTLLRYILYMHVLNLNKDVHTCEALAPIKVQTRPSPGKAQRCLFADGSHPPSHPDSEWPVPFLFSACKWSQTPQSGARLPSLSRTPVRGPHLCAHPYLTPLCLLLSGALLRDRVIHPPAHRPLGMRLLWSLRYVPQTSSV